MMESERRREMRSGRRSGGGEGKCTSVEDPPSFCLENLAQGSLVTDS